MYGTAIMDGYPQKIANFRIEPPGLFRGRGEHPKMGMLKRRVMPEDIIINCSKYVLREVSSGKYCIAGIPWCRSHLRDISGRRYDMTIPSRG